jgi:hypothetical protein
MAGGGVVTQDLAAGFIEYFSQLMIDKGQGVW